MPRLRIDIDELTLAMSDHDSEWVLDTETGKTLMAEWIRDPDLREDMGLELDEPGDGEADDDLGDFDLLDSDRFVWIDPVESYESFRWMEDFADRQDGSVRERLLDALDRPRPFRRFKDALLEFPQVRDAWFAYEDQKLKEAAREWIRYREIDADLVEADPPPS